MLCVNRFLLHIVRPCWLSTLLSVTVFPFRICADLVVDMEDRYTHRKTNCTHRHRHRGSADWAYQSHTLDCLQVEFACWISPYGWPPFNCFYLTLHRTCTDYILFIADHPSRYISTWNLCRSDSPRKTGRFRCPASAWVHHSLARLRSTYWNNWRWPLNSVILLNYSFW